MRMALIESYSGTDPQLIELLEKDYVVWLCWRKYGLVRGDVSLNVGFQVSQVSLSLTLLPTDENVKFSTTASMPCLLISYSLP